MAQARIDPAVWRAYFGGDRGAVAHRAAYDRLRVDWLGFDAGTGEWDLRGATPTVLIQESVAVFGERPHELARGCGGGVLTYLRRLDGFEGFEFVPIPYDFGRSAMVEHSSPMSRPRTAHYCFGRKRGGVYGESAGEVFGRAEYRGQQGLRFELAAMAGVVTTAVGPRFEDKIAAMSGHRFGIACENLVAEGYVTEKLWDCFVADVVPIYFGGVLPAAVEACVMRPTTADWRGVREVLEMSDAEYARRLAAVRRVRGSADVIGVYGYGRFLAAVDVLADEGERA